MTQAPGELPRAVAIVGPTASGKSRLGLALAERLGLEILCCDSVQVYRRLDIGSAKPSAEDRARAPHHLLDLVEPDGSFSAGDYARAAHALLQRGPALLVGGTGFYLRATYMTQSAGADGGDAPLSDPQRAAFTAMWEERERAQPGAAHAELQRVDAASAATIHPRNLVRTVRTLWLCEVHGRPVSSVRAEDPPRPRLRLAMIELDPGVAHVDAAIERRCDVMVERGWLAEVAGLLADGYDTRHKSMRSLGYRQLLRHLQGECSLDQATAEIKAETRRYARRQRTYFRHQIRADVSIRIRSPDECPIEQLEGFLREGAR